MTNSMRVSIINAASTHARAASHVAARVRDFSERLRVRRLDHEAIRSGPRESLVAALEEDAEELAVAEEELSMQVEELATTLDAIDFERRRFRELFDVTSDALVVTDRSGVIIVANRRAAAVLAFDAARMVGKPLVVVVAPDDVKRVRDLVDAPVVDEPFELTLKTRAGTPIPVSARCGWLANQTQLAWSFQPIDERYAALSNAELARALRDKTELLERERATRKHLEREGRARDRFLSVLSHDLRGPIHAVLGWAQVLSKEILAKPARDKALATIERNSRAQLALVEELLDLSRIAAGKMQLEIVSVDLALLVRRVVDGFVPDAADAGTTLSCEIAEDAPVIVFGDTKRLEQIVRNLVTNALKFAAGGRVRVSVHEEGGHAIVRVEDNGRGIAPALLASVFDIYRQEKADGDGLGLGLTIVRQLAELHGGTAEGESDGIGKGATFTFRMPSAARGEAAPNESSHPLPLPETLDGTRILLVEDEEDARDLLREILAHQGAQLALAQNAEEAIALFRPFRPDVVVSDVGLPGDDGCTLVRMLRQLDPRIPAIALTGFAGGTDVARSLEAGFDVHLSKPIEPGKLVAAIQRLVEA